MEQNSQFCPPPIAPAQTLHQTIIVKGVPRSNGVGTAGFVLSLITLFLGWFPVAGWVLWFMGALLSFIGVFKAPRGLAIAGLIISFVGVIIIVTFTGLVLAALSCC